MHRGNPFEVAGNARVFAGRFANRPWYPPRIALFSTSFWYGSLIPLPPPVDEIDCPLSNDPEVDLVCEYKSANIGTGLEDVRCGFYCEVVPHPGVAHWQYQVWVDGAPQLSYLSYDLWVGGGNWNVGFARLVSTPPGPPPLLVPVGVIQGRAKRYTD